MRNVMVYAIHAPDSDHLVQVAREMQAMGAPRIEVIDCGDYYMAMEGSHRLAAAAELGLSPEFVVYAQDDLIDVTRYDWYDSANWAESHYSAGEVAGELYSPKACGYQFAA